MVTNSVPESHAKRRDVHENARESFSGAPIAVFAKMARKAWGGSKRNGRNPDEKEFTVVRQIRRVRACDTRLG
jgi:hypothetical protein